MKPPDKTVAEILRAERHPENGWLLTALLNAQLAAQASLNACRDALEEFDPELGCHEVVDHTECRWGIEGDRLWVQRTPDGAAEEFEVGLGTHIDVDVYQRDVFTLVSVYDTEELVTLYVFTAALRQDGAP